MISSLGLWTYVCCAVVLLNAFALVLMWSLKYQGNYTYIKTNSAWKTPG